MSRVRLPTKVAVVLSVILAAVLSQGPLLASAAPAHHLDTIMQGGEESAGQASSAAVATAPPAVQPYLRQGERAVSVARISLSNGQQVDMVALVPQDMKNATIRDVLMDWYDSIVDRERYLFPIIPVDQGGNIHVEDLAEALYNLCLLATVNPSWHNPHSSYQLTAKDRQNIQDIYNRFALYHVGDDVLLGYTDALEELLTYSSALAVARGGWSSDRVGQIAAVIAPYAGKLAETKVSDVANEVWNRAFNQALSQAGSNMETAMQFADQSSATYDKVWRVSQKYHVGNMAGLALSEGTAVFERWVAAAAPMADADQVIAELEAVRELLPQTPEGLRLRTALDRVVQRARGEVSVFWDRLRQSIASGEFAVDAGVPAVKFVAQWGLRAVPVAGQILLAVDVGWAVGNLLTNNPEVSRQFESAKYVAEIESLLHNATYRTAYEQLRSQVQSGTVDTTNLQAYRAGAHLTYLTEALCWEKVRKGYSSASPLVEAARKAIWGNTGAEAAEALLPMAQAPARASDQWLRPSVVRDLTLATLCRLQQRPERSSDLALVVDSSGSMEGDKLSATLRACSLLVDSAEPQDKLAVVTFNNDASRVASLTQIRPEAEEADRAALRSRLGVIDAGGGTDIGAGLQMGLAELSAASKDVARAIILLSDGQNNRGNLEQAVAQVVAARVPVLAIGFGQDADKSTLGQIAERTGGRYFDADVLNVQQVYMLADTFMRGNSELLHVAGLTRQGELQTYELTVSRNVRSISVLVSWFGSQMALTLLSPGGRTINPEAAAADPNVSFRSTSTTASYVVRNPEPGLWHVTTVGVVIPPEGEQFTLSASAQTDFSVSPSGFKANYRVGEPVPLGVVLRHQDLSDQWAAMPAEVWAQVTDPAGRLNKVRLFDDGAHDDGDPADGYYTSNPVSADSIGVYKVAYEIKSPYVTDSNQIIRASFLVGTAREIAQGPGFRSVLDGIAADARRRASAGDTSALPLYVAALKARCYYAAITCMEDYLVDAPAPEKSQRAGVMAGLFGQEAGVRSCQVLAADGSLIVAGTTSRSAQGAGGAQNLQQPSFQPLPAGYALTVPVGRPVEAAVCLQLTDDPRYAQLTGALAVAPRAASAWSALENAVVTDAGVAFATQLAAACPHYLTTPGLGPLGAMLTQACGEPNVAYSIVAGREGALLAYVGLEPGEQFFFDDVSRRAYRTEKALVQKSTWAGRPLRDVSVPVLVNGRKVGVMRLGIVQR